MFNFPATPTENQEFTPAGGVTYVYKAPRWTAKGNVYVTEAPNDANAYVRQALGWVVGYSKTALDSAIGTKVAKSGDTMTGPLVMQTAGQSGALIQLRPAAAPNSIEWGHSNTAGYGNTLGYLSGSGTGFLAFSAEAGSTANSFRTRGVKGSVLLGDLAGGFVFGTVITANADNQGHVPILTLSAGGLLAAISGSFSNVLTAPTVATADSSLNVATTAFVKAQGYLAAASASTTYAPLANPPFSGVVTMPTLLVGTSTSGASAGGGIILSERTSGFSEGIYFRNEANLDRGYIGFDPSDQLVLRIGDSVTTDVTIGAGGAATFGGTVTAPRLDASKTSDARTVLLALTRTSSVAGFAGMVFGNGAYGFLDYDVNSTNGIRLSALGPLRLGSNTNAVYGAEVFTEQLRVASTGVSIPGATASSSKTTGALIVSGGVGVAGQLTANALTVDAANSAALSLDKGLSGQNSIVYGRTAGIIRWYMTLGNSAAETGANVGSDFQITACRDADGVAIFTPLQIARNTGKVTMGVNIASASPTTGTLTLGGGLGVGGQIFAGSSINTAGNVLAAGASFISNHASVLILGMASGVDGTLYFRPNGYDTGANQMSLGSTGVLTVTTDINCGGKFTGDNLSPGNGAFIGLPTQVILGTQASSIGALYLRPNGWNTSLNQTVVNSTGDMSVSGSISTGSAGNVSAGALNTAGGASGGVTMYASGPVYHSVASAASTDIERFYSTQTPFLNGRINVQSTITSYVTFSDERFKEIDEELAAEKAIAVIRADPVLDFRWKTTGTRGIGWAAQRSHAIDPDLAVPPAYNEEELAVRASAKAEPQPGDPGFVPWGIDYGRRTPYLWAALAWVLDELETLTARVAAMEEA